MEWSGIWLSLLSLLNWDWAIVCGVCYYRKLLQMQQFHPKCTPGLVITNYADNARYHRKMIPYGIKNGVKWYRKPDYTVLESMFYSYALRETSFCVLPPRYTSLPLLPTLPHLPTIPAILIH